MSENSTEEVPPVDDDPINGDELAGEEVEADNYDPEEDSDE